MDNKNPATARHTPVTLMAVFADAFKIEAGSRKFWLQGVYQDRKRGSYQGYYYDRLQDEFGGQIITVKIPEGIKQTLKDGEYYLFIGLLDKDVRWDGVIEPVFIVTELAKQVANALAAGVDKRTALQQKKAKMGYRDLEKMIREKVAVGKRPCLALICGKTSIVLQDVFSALKDAKTRYDFVEHRVNLFNKQAIIDALSNHNDDRFDGIAIIRGGGPGLEIFDDVAIAEAGLKLQPILITAIGHAQDITLLQQIADKKFATPTALGTYLRETAVPTPINHSQTNAHEQNQLKLAPASWITLALIILILGILLGSTIGRF